MIRIEVDFEAIREKLYDVVDSVLDAAEELETKFNEAVAGQTQEVALDIETTPFDMDKIRETMNKLKLQPGFFNQLK